jgi:hypothetical protein
MSWPQQNVTLFLYHFGNLLDIIVAKLEMHTKSIVLFSLPLHLSSLLQSIWKTTMATVIILVALPDRSPLALTRHPLPLRQQRQPTVS